MKGRNSICYFTPTLTSRFHLLFILNIFKTQVPVIGFMLKENLTSPWGRRFVTIAHTSTRRHTPERRTHVRKPIFLGPVPDMPTYENPVTLPSVTLQDTLSVAAPEFSQLQEKASGGQGNRCEIACTFKKYCRGMKRSMLCLVENNMYAEYKKRVHLGYQLPIRILFVISQFFLLDFFELYCSSWQNATA